MPLFSLLFLAPAALAAQAAILARLRHAATRAADQAARRAAEAQDPAGAPPEPAADTNMFAAEDIDLRPAVTRVLARLAPAAARTHTKMGFAVETGLHVRANPHSFGQALADAILRALGRAPGGAVLVSAGRHGGRVQIAVSDDGAPEPATATAEDARAGLRAAEQTIALLGGSIELRTAAQGGACVIRLPDAGAHIAARAAPAPATPVPAPPAPAPGTQPALAPRPKVAWAS